MTPQVKEMAKKIVREALEVICVVFLMLVVVYILGRIDTGVNERIYEVEQSTAARYRYIGAYPETQHPRWVVYIDGKEGVSAKEYSAEEAKAVLEMSNLLRKKDVFSLLYPFEASLIYFGLPLYLLVRFTIWVIRFIGWAVKTLRKNRSE